MKLPMVNHTAMRMSLMMLKTSYRRRGWPASRFPEGPRAGAGRGPVRRPPEGEPSGASGLATAVHRAGARGGQLGRGRAET